MAHKIIDSMCTFDVYCFLCGNPARGGDNENSHIANETSWMNQCTFLTVLDQVVHQCRQIEGNAFMDYAGNEFVHVPSNDNPKLSATVFGKKGLFVHTDCWVSIANKHNFKLKYSSLPKLMPDDNEVVPFEFIDYGPIEQYWDQFFEFDEVWMASNDHLCQSPLKKNSHTHKRVLQNYSHLNIKMRRKGPACSASMFDEGDVKIGPDHNFWNIENGKWVAIAHERPARFFVTVPSDKPNAYVTHLKYAAETSVNPIFIIAVQQNNSSMTCQLELLTFESLVSPVEEKILKSDHLDFLNKNKIKTRVKM